LKPYQFADTNIFIYSIGRDPAEMHKRVRAEEILKNRKLALSTQVLQEFYVQATRPSRRSPLSHEVASELIMGWRRFKIQPVTLAVFENALRIKGRYGFNYWDCAIIAAAKELKCDVLYTEDLQHNQVVEGIRVVNPFTD
jgi:predicted nucleic acid-binding protein